MLASSDQKHSTNYVFFSHEVPFPVYTNVTHISCGVSSGVSGKYFATLCKALHLGKAARLTKVYVNFKNFS